ncbi:MAG: cell envelope integrity protein CreD [Lentisphaerae bacterium]|nr:cell envelope integrity protein CreD [Lentisphaerota bacterium]
MDTTPKRPNNAKSFLEKHAATFKMAGILILILVLLIPLAMIRSILHERMVRRNEAVAGITATWGGEQELVGPVLVIPYLYKVKAWREQTVNGKPERLEVEETHTANAFFLPAELAIAGTVTPSKLHRGIYEAVVYKGRLTITGRFAPPAFAELGIAAENMLWDKALVTLAVSDLRGTGEMLRLKLGTRTYDFMPGSRLKYYVSGISARTPGVWAEGTNLEFQMALDLKGSRGISFAPVGQQNRVKLTSTWADPSFSGAFLPAEREVSAAGFDAAWEISWYGRRYPQQSSDQGQGYAFTADSITPSLFGVDFILPVDTYRMVERATKYGALFITLVFAAFFLFEVLAALRIHTIQYTLIGAALCLFYLAVLSLSEFIRFGYAYGAGVLASSLLIILYSLGALKSGWRSALIAAILLAIYTYLYVVLQLQDYSLLFGTAGLFVVLGIVMYVTRKLDWATRA